MANKTKEDDINTIDFIIDQIDTCISFITNLRLEEFLADIKTCYAVSMALQVICENSSKITDETKNKSSAIEWKKMSGLRMTRSISPTMMVSRSSTPRRQHESSWRPSIFLRKSRV